MMRITCIAFGALVFVATHIFGENIIRYSCNTEATFYKIASNYSMTDASKVTKSTEDGVLGCIDLCIELSVCKAFNYKSIGKNSATCELLQKDRTISPNDIFARSGWSYYDTGLFSSQIGQLCRSFTYNPCYPCLCIDSCYSAVGYTCNCTNESPPRPEIYVAFEKTVDGDSSKSPYERGEDRNGNSQVSLVNGARVGVSSGRSGKALLIQGTNAGATMGYFQGHPINNPASTKYSISLWLRVASPHSSTQNVFGCGRNTFTTGTLVRVKNYAKAIHVRCVLSDAALISADYQVHDTLQTWTHLALTVNTISGRQMKLYLNGRLVGLTTSTTSQSASSSNYPYLIFGAGSLFDITNDHWNIHIDDFAIWKDHDLSSEEVIYVMNKGFV